METRFIPGLELSGAFYQEGVRAVLQRRFPHVPYAAARIGDGSEVLGLDDAMSTDHHWGPCLQLFMGEDDYRRWADAIGEALAEDLPPACRGYSTHFSEPDPADGGVQHMRPSEGGRVNHRVELHTLRGYFAAQLGLDIAGPIEPADWLSLYEQRLLSVTAGAVYHDEVGLEAVRQRLAYYPRDVWLALMAADWTRIGQEEHLMGRAGFVGDEIGSAVIAARLVRDIMHLGFLMERRYAPYPKWFGTAFGRLDCEGELAPHLAGALAATAWPQREQHLARAYEGLARRHNRLGLTRPMPEHVKAFHGRPFQVMALHGFAEALVAEIGDPAVRRIAERTPIGSIAQFSDSTDLLDTPRLRPILRRLYE